MNTLVCKIFLEWKNLNLKSKIIFWNVYFIPKTSLDFENSGFFFFSIDLTIQEKLSVKKSNNF